MSNTGEQRTPQDTMGRARLALHQGNVDSARTSLTEATPEPDSQLSREVGILLGVADLLAGNYAASRARFTSLIEDTYAINEGRSDESHYGDMARLAADQGLAAWAEALTGPEARRLDSIVENYVLLWQYYDEVIDNRYKDANTVKSISWQLAAALGLVGTYLPTEEDRVKNIRRLRGVRYNRKDQPDQYVFMTLAYAGRLIGTNQGLMGKPAQDEIRAALNSCFDQIEQHDRGHNWRIARAILESINEKFIWLTNVNQNDINAARARASQALNNVDPASRNAVEKLQQLLVMAPLQPVTNNK